MHEEPCHDDFPDLRDDNVNELIVTGHRRTLDAIKRAIAAGVPGATRNTTVRRDWHRSLHVTYSTPGECGFEAADELAMRWRRASFVLAFDHQEPEHGGNARWEAGELTALEYDDSPYRDDGCDWDYVTVGHSRARAHCATMTPPRLASLCLLARCYGWRADEAILRALDATLDPIDAVRLEDEPEMDLAVATLPAEEAVRLADALRVARGCFGVPVEILDGLGIRGEAPPGGAYGTGRADDLERTTLRTIREVLEAASAGVELVVQRTILARPARD